MLEIFKQDKCLQTDKRGTIYEFKDFSLKAIVFKDFIEIYSYILNKVYIKECLMIIYKYFSMFSESDNNTK